MSPPAKPAAKPSPAEFAREVAENLNSTHLQERADGPELWQALLAARSEIPEIPRNATGQIQNRQYAYATLDDTYQAVLPVLASHSLVLSHEPVRGGCFTRLVHAPTAQYVFCFSAIPEDVDAQQRGVWLSYMSRYHVFALLAIFPETDVDGAGAAHPAQRAQGTPSASSPARRPQRASGGQQSGKPACPQCGKRILMESKQKPGTHFCWVKSKPEYGGPGCGWEGVVGDANPNQAAAGEENQEGAPTKDDLYAILNALEKFNVSREMVEAYLEGSPSNPKGWCSKITWENIDELKAVGAQLKDGASWEVATGMVEGPPDDDELPF